MAKQGILIVVSGFSGAGKGSLMKALIAKYENYALSVSATTRQPRENEKDGQDYFFVTKEIFEEMIDRDQLIEYASYQDHYYGTPKKYVDEQLAAGKDVILEIEVQGASKVKSKFPDTILIFVAPPSAGELRRRLMKRGTETEAQIQGRLRRAVEEAEYMSGYDYVLINDDLNETAEKLNDIVCTEHIKCSRNADFIFEITRELKTIMKGE